MNVLYLDCFSGISGDMTVGALLDLGADPGVLMKGLESLGVQGWSITTQKGHKGVLAGTAFRVHLTEDPDGKDRSLSEIETLISGGTLTEKAKRIALQAFRHLAEAEASVHGTLIEDVHFHEVGAVDSILDIVGAAICTDQLAFDEIVISPIPMSRGFVRCRHGLIPLPAPATLTLAKGIPIRRPPAPTARELATPTGLAIAKAIATRFDELPEGIVEEVGYGLGGAELPWPNVLRAVQLKTSASGQGRVLQMEANLDDMTGEALGYALDRLISEGALDAWLEPIHMKKGRPGHILKVLCEPEQKERLAEVMFCETTTIGLRYASLDRSILPRESITVNTRFGAIRCKVATLEGAIPRVKPEYEDCRKAAQAAQVPLGLVADEALRSAWQQLGILHS